jgi:hypothetical protein
LSGDESLTSIPLPSLHIGTQTDKGTSSNLTAGLAATKLELTILRSNLAHLKTSLLDVVEKEKMQIAADFRHLQQFYSQVTNS